jgi:ElaB/YqjD/DUF883 family membrane-anchored ribosome-binding protein
MNAPAATAIGSNGAGRAKAAVETPFEQLFAGVDDLIRRVADVENPEIRKVRAKVYAALVAAKSAHEIKSEFGANRLRREPMQIRGGEPMQAAGGKPLQAEITGDDMEDDDMEDYGGQALGVALLVGLSVGLIVSVRQ